jgi:hypothetical protein
MRARLTILGALAILVAGCGHSSPPPQSSTQTTSQKVALKVYFYKGNALVPVTVHVPETRAVATAAIGALLAGPPTGYTTAIPAGVRLRSLAVSKGIASAKLSSANLAHDATGQIVYTLTQFPTVSSVDGSTRDDYADLTTLAPIFIGSPLREATVSSPVHVSGTADVFEGTIAYEVWSGSRKLRSGFTTASAGTGTRGTWDVTFALPAGPARLVFYEPSAENGRPLHETELDLTVQ